MGGRRAAARPREGRLSPRTVGIDPTMFHVKQSVRGSGSVVLVDDVLSSGATSTAAASALLRAGAEAVEMWVCVRAV